MKALRIALAVLAGAVLLILIAAVVIIRTFDLNDYKDEIAAYVEERTGRALTIDDTIEFSLFPWFAVETGGIALSDDPGFGDRSFATVDSLSARLRIWPLFRRRIEIGRVILDGINLNLGVDAEGRGNWSTLLPAQSPESSPVDSPAPERPSINALAVEGIELRNARILWHDAEGEVSVVVRDVDLVTGPVNDDDPITVSVSLSLLDVASQASAEIELETVAALRAPLALDETVAGIRLIGSDEAERGAATIALGPVRLDGSLISIGPADLTARLERPPVGPETLAIEAGLSSAELDLESENLLVTGLGARIGGIDASFTLQGTTVLSDPRLTGTALIDSSRLAAVLDLLGVATPDVWQGQDPGALRASADFELAVPSRTFSVGRFELTALGLEATGQAALGDDRTLTAELEVPAARPGEPLLGLIRSHVPEGVEPGVVTSAGLSAALELDTASGRLEISPLSLDLDDATLAGRVVVDDLRAPDRINGAVTAAGLDNRLLGGLFGAWLPAELLEAPLGEFRLATDFDYETRSRTAVLAPLELTAYGLTGDGELTIVDSPGELALSGRAALAPFSPAGLLTRFALPVPQTSDPTVLRTAEVAASFETRGPNGEFRDIVITLDDARITGRFSVDDFSDPSYEFLLRADRIDADRYLPPRAAAAAEIDGAPGRLLGEMRLSNESLTATVINGTASIGHLHIGGMDFEQLETELAFGDGRAALSSVETLLYGGEFQGGLTIDATGDRGSVRLTGNASAISLAPLLEAMLGNANLSGTGDITLDLRGLGDTINEVLQSATGVLDLTLREGEINGVNLGRRLCEAVNARRGLPAPASAPTVTRYDVIRSSAAVSDGVASSDDLYATTGFLELTGRGSTRIVDQWIDHQYRASLTGPIPIAGCEDLNRTIADDPIPVNFTLEGRLPDVEVGLDISQLLEDWARREIRQRAQDEVGERLQDALRGVFE